MGGWKPGLVPYRRRWGKWRLFHGYTSDKSKLLTEAEFFRSQGFSVLLLDFAGNGGSEGVQTTVGYREADDVATAFLSERKTTCQRPCFCMAYRWGRWPF